MGHLLGRRGLCKGHDAQGIVAVCKHDVLLQQVGAAFLNRFFVCEDPRRNLVPLIQLRVHVVLHTTVATCTALVPYTVTLYWMRKRTYTDFLRDRF